MGLDAIDGGTGADVVNGGDHNDLISGGQAGGPRRRDARFRDDAGNANRKAHADGFAKLVRALHGGRNTYRLHANLEARR